jgi:hypothetical protein
MASTQVSAYLSDTTRDQLERYSKAHGVKKGHLVEEALLHHLLALRELPADLIVPPALELTPTSFAEVAKRVASPRKPTKAMKALMARTRRGKAR